MFQVVVHGEDADELRLHPRHLHKHESCGEGMVRFRFGAQSAPVRLRPAPELGLRAIAVPERLAEQLAIPLMCRYDLLLEEHAVTIGPVIGMLAERTEAKLAKRLRHPQYPLSDYMADYDRVGGAVLLFSLDGVNREERTIDGFVFRPDAGRWERGTFRYPAALFNRVRLNSAWRTHWQSAIGNRVFNSHCLNKWNMYALLKSDPQLGACLPDTAPCRQAEDVLQFADRHRRLYIKPVRGSAGRNIMKAARLDGGWLVGVSGKTCDGSIRLDDGSPDTALFFDRYLAGGSWIAQQAIDVIAVQDKPIDFRLILVKNELGQWEDMGLVSRYGRAGGIVCNIHSGGTADIGERTIRRALCATDEEAAALRRRMSDIAVRTAGVLDRRGAHYGNLGLDMAIDRSGRIWILEVNHRNPDHSIAADAGDRALYRRCLLANMLYAKRLSGFPAERGGCAGEREGCPGERGGCAGEREGCPGERKPQPGGEGEACVGN